MRLTVGLLAFNEAETLPTVVSAVAAALESAGIDGEVLVLDDGSTDATPEVMAGLATPRIRTHRFPANRGRAHAIAAAFTEGHGEAIAVMDADGQYEPTDLAALLAAIDEGADVANGVRVDRADTAWRRFVSRTYNAVIMRLLSGVTTADANSGVKVFRADAVPCMGYDPSRYRRGHRFLIAHAERAGLRISEVPVGHLDRQGGRSYIKAPREALHTIRDVWTFRRGVDLRSATTGQPARTEAGG